LTELLHENEFGILVDESTYNNKVRLEYWIIYFDEANHRRLQYLSTEELHVDLDVEKFLSSSSSVTLDDMTLVTSENILNATLNTLKKFNLDLGNLIFLMTDNCNVMTGNRKGFKTQLKECCPNLMETTGCICHTAHLLQKDEIKSSTIQGIVNFAQHLSNFLDNKSKVKSILHQCEKFLELKRIKDYCPTRFLSLFEVLHEFCSQFPVIKKIILMSNDQELIKCVESDFFLVHVDQFLIHSVPIFDFTKCMQRGDLTIYGCLLTLLELISKLLTRLGQSVELSPRSYLSKLYMKPTGRGEPRLARSFSSQTSQCSNLQYSKNNHHLIAALDHLLDSEIRDIKAEWDKHNEDQLSRLLNRFSPFLSSDIVHYCYVLFLRIEDFSKESVNRLGLLCEAIDCSRSTVQDELSSLRVKTQAEGIMDLSLVTSFEKGHLRGYPLLLHVCKSVLLILPHNMSVERGFSEMKHSESKFQANITLETYDSRRFVSGFFSRDTFESYEPPTDLLKLLSEASSKYRAVSKEMTEQKAIVSLKSMELRRELQVYKRRNPSSVKADIIAVDKELKKAEEDMEKLRAKRQKLEEERRSHSDRYETVSASVIDRFFNSRS